MLMIFQPPSQVGFVSCIVPESWRLRKFSINHYRFGHGRVTWEGQSESFPEYQRNLSHFRKGAEIKSGESGNKPGPRLPFCARKPGQLHPSKQMAAPVPCHPGHRVVIWWRLHIRHHLGPCPLLSALLSPVSGQITGVPLFLWRLFSAPERQLPVPRRVTQSAHGTCPSRSSLVWCLSFQTQAA